MSCSSTVFHSPVQMNEREQHYHQHPSAEEWLSSPVSSLRPLPPWPISPAMSYSSPEISTTDRSAPVCPGAPMKGKISRSHIFRDNNGGEDDYDDDDVRPRFLPTRLRFDGDITDDCIIQNERESGVGNGKASARNNTCVDNDIYPILHMPPSSPLRHDDRNCPVLGLRPQRLRRRSKKRDAAPSMGIVPTNSTTGTNH